MLKLWAIFPLLFAVQLEANPGLKIRITQKGLNYGKEVGMKILQQEIKKRMFPDWNGTQKLFFGHFHYRITRTKITSISIPYSSVIFIPDIGIQLSIKGASAVVGTNWSLNSWLFKDHGEAKVSLSGASITAVIMLSKSKRGYPSLALKSCHISIRKIKIQLNGRARWLYGLAIHHLEGSVREQLENGLCLPIRYIIKKLDTALQTVEVLSQIDSFTQIDYSLINPPKVSRFYINLDFKGTVYPIRNHIELPFVAAPFSLPDNYEYMLYCGVSEYFFKSASLSYYTAGAFNIKFLEEFSSSMNLTTKALSRFIPEVAQHYILPHLVKMVLMLTAAPGIKLQGNRFAVEIPCFMEVSVVLPDGAMQRIFAVNISTSTDASVTIAEQKLIVSLNGLKSFHLSLAHSNIGSFQVSLLRNLLSYILRNKVIPPINTALKRGFRFPNMAGFALLRPVVKINQGYLLISTDVDYKY